MSGHINKVHSVHLFSYHLLAFRVQGTKVEVQIANQEQMYPWGTPAKLVQYQSTFPGQRENITLNDVNLDGAHH
jgi:hypothetical protein